MDRFLNATSINIPRDTVRFYLTGQDFITQLGKITDLNNQPLLNNPGWKGITKVQQGFGVEYPTARVAIISPRPEILRSGIQLNLYCTLVTELLFRFSARDEDDIDVDIQPEAHALATYVWNWLTPGGNQNADNPNGMVPLYPNVWDWDESRKDEQSLDRNVLHFDKGVTGMSGSLYGMHLYSPIRIFNPLVPYPV